LHQEDNRNDGNSSQFYKYPREILQVIMNDHHIHLHLHKNINHV